MKSFYKDFLCMYVCMYFQIMHHVDLAVKFLSNLLQVQCVSGKGEMPLSGAGLVALTEDNFEKTKHLFESSNVFLWRDGDTVKTDIDLLRGDLPLVLCIAVRGLASLAHSLN